MRLIITALLLPTLVAGLLTARAAGEPAKTRVLLITGDDVKAIQTPEVAQLIVQGTAWAAGQ